VRRFLQVHATQRPRSPIRSKVSLNWHELDLVLREFPGAPGAHESTPIIAVGGGIYQVNATKRGFGKMHEEGPWSDVGDDAR
jgi:hypothetical protein